MNYYLFQAIKWFLIACITGIIIFFNWGCAEKLEYQCPEITLPPVPALQIKKLTLTSTPAQVWQAYVYDLNVSRGWITTVNREIKIDNAAIHSTKQ